MCLERDRERGGGDSALCQFHVDRTLPPTKPIFSTHLFQPINPCVFFHNPTSKWAWDSLFRSPYCLEDAVELLCNTKCLYEGQILFSTSPYTFICASYLGIKVGSLTPSLYTIEIRCYHFEELRDPEGIYTAGHRTSQVSQTFPVNSEAEGNASQQQSTASSQSLEPGRIAPSRTGHASAGSDEGKTCYMEKEPRTSAGRGNR